ncbi:ankyrin repeat-containing domain protein, partial [Baffinella frigidus]
EIVRLLIEKGADTSIADKRGDLPLHYTVRGGVNDAIFTALLASPTAHLDLATKNGDGETALIQAVCQGYRGTAEFLLKHGADVEDGSLTHAVDIKVLWRAVEKGDSRIVQMFLDWGIGVDSKEDSTGITLLMKAAWGWDTRVFETILSNGADMSTCDKAGKTALHHAAEHGSVISLKILISEGADLFAESNDGSIP